MVDKTVNLRDISPFQTEITCLPFTILDEDFLLLEKLHREITRRHGDFQNRKIMQDAIFERHNLITNNRVALANEYHRPVNEIYVENRLSKVFEEKGLYFQYLTTDLLVNLNDSRARFKQDPIYFILSEDQKTWQQLVPNVGKPSPQFAAPVLKYGPRPAPWVSPYSQKPPTNS
jgi:hypothetical protein